MEAIAAPGAELAHREVKDIRELNPGRYVQVLANAIHTSEVEEFNTGDIRLREVSPLDLGTLIGIDPDGRSQDSGFRFQDHINEREVDSEPDFATKNPFVKEGDLVSSVVGNVDVKIGDSSHNIVLMITGVNRGTEGGMTYQLDVGFGPSWDHKERDGYLDLVARHCHKKASV